MNNINSIIESEANRFRDEISKLTLTEFGELIKQLGSGIAGHGNALNASRLVGDEVNANKHILSASANLLTVAGVARAMHELIVSLCDTEGVTIHISYREGRLFVETQKTSHLKNDTVSFLNETKPKRKNKK